MDILTWTAFLKKCAYLLFFQAICNTSSDAILMCLVPMPDIDLDTLFPLQGDSEEPRIAVTMTDKSSPVKVVRHDVGSSSQTKTSSGVLKVVQHGDKIDDKNQNFENESFHVGSPPAFLQNQPAFIDDDNYCRFSTNFVSPPLRKIPSQPHGRGAVIQVLVTEGNDFVR